MNDREGLAAAPLWVVMQAGSLAAVFLLGAAAVRWNTRRGPLPILVGGTAVWAGVKLLKVPVGRERPSAYLDRVRVRGAEQSGLGYPSGHAAVATLLAILATRPGPSRRLAHGVAGMTGLARIHVGAHLPLDVVGGLAIGTLAADGIDALLDARSNRASVR